MAFNGVETCFVFLYHSTARIKNGLLKTGILSDRSKSHKTSLPTHGIPIQGSFRRDTSVNIDCDRHLKFCFMKTSCQKTAKHMIRYRTEPFLRHHNLGSIYFQERFWYGCRLIGIDLALELTAQRNSDPSGYILRAVLPPSSPVLHNPGGFPGMAT
jgi:hypothetical protein